MEQRWGADRWEEALAARYFSPAFSQQPVTFCVDRDELASIRGKSAEQAQTELLSIVRREVMPGFHFERVARRASAWERAGREGPPPSLLLLAVAVLAAGQEQAGAAGAPSYYKSFRRLLDPDDAAGGEPDGYGEHLPALWEQLRRWLESFDGARGIPTITKHQQHTFVGYARQQAALRVQDQRRFERFLAAIGFEPGDTTSPRELRRGLAIWAKRLGPSGHRLHRLATDPSLEVYADDLIERLCDRWDGRIRDVRTGRPELTIRLTMGLRMPTLGLVVERRRDDPDLVELTWEGGSTTLVPGPDPCWYIAGSLPDPGVAITSGLELHGDPTSASFDPADAFVLDFDEGLACYVTAGTLQLGEAMQLLVSAGVRIAAEEWLRQEGAGGSLDARATPHLPGGWFLIRDVRINARPQHVPPRPIANLLGTSGGARSHLVGGLRLAIARRAYLQDGLPALVLAEGEGSRQITIETSGHPAQSARVEASEYPLNLLGLAAGEYSVRHPGGVTTFDVLRGLSEAPGARVGSIAQTAIQGRTVRGLIADVVPLPPPVVVAVRDDVRIAIGCRPGEVGVVERPHWLCDVAGPLSWRTIDVWTSFEPAWLLTPRGDGTYVAHPAGALEPSSGGFDTQWGRLVRASTLGAASPDENSRWGRYVDAAGDESQ